jgi:hypothetical protein
MIKNKKGTDDVVIYDGQQDEVNVRDIKMTNKNKEDQQVVYQPDVLELQS